MGPQTLTAVSASAEEAARAAASAVAQGATQALADAPETVNSDPYGAWLFRITLSDAAELAALMDAAAYEKALG